MTKQVKTKHSVSVNKNLLNNASVLFQAKNQNDVKLSQAIDIMSQSLLLVASEALPDDYTQELKDQFYTAYNGYCINHKIAKDGLIQTINNMSSEFYQSFIYESSYTITDIDDAMRVIDAWTNIQKLAVLYDVLMFWTPLSSSDKQQMFIN
ncbi:hypothetical protein PVK64_14905 [Aliivibrio sp. S4TY2]|uniref:Uncharacterized protein n=1 Tax=Aliivibrio finisterrensis TaxID=511998 RepID=A0A4Q5KTF7_9GAMM|nr:MULTISPECIES: hypothetical protein [Aliivibrio]MDD9157461.1 hypothetical protein [Aliivibrio sp. S4TY2]MDD9161345.1 hypothetical protein [Aliivibrio sp. S4TY1]MDD9165375.1 hypothetical protein [Aliivibrio sp. S4MY2]MDD9169370.1 hypothetical protein [Aliivibrio sp. S4MY4]MDD9179250.1 hypothetical protein [Aliivibrio sp. A6]